MKYAVCVLLMGCCGGALSTAAAQEAPLAALYGCRDIEADAERLACYDEAVGKIRTGEEAGDLAVVTKEQVAEVNVRSFGSPEPDISSLAPQVKEAKKLDRIDSPIVAYRAGGNGKLRFELENGQIWRQTDTTRVDLRGDGPWPATVKRAAFGSFLLSTDGARGAVRVQRAE